MTVGTTVDRNDYIGNGATGVYAYSWKAQVEADIRVVVRDPVTNIDKPALTLATDYTLDGIGEDGGGNVTLIDSGQAWMDGSGNLITDWALVARRVVELKQETDIANQGSFFPKTHEDQFDKLLMQIQQINNDVQGAMRLPDSVDPGSVSTVLPFPEANLGMRWNASADALENFDLVAMGNLVLPAANGIMVKTAVGIFTKREITTASGIGSSNGDGVSGDPLLFLTTGGVATIHLADLNVTNAKMALGAISGSNIIPLTVSGGAIANLTIIAANMGLGSISGSNIVPLTVSGGAITNLAIVTGKIGPEAVTGDKIGEGGIQVYFTVNSTQTQTGLTAANIFNSTIQGGVLAANRMARLEAICEFSNPDGVARDVTVALIYGTTTIGTCTLTIPATTTEVFKLTALMGNQSASVQEGLISVDSESVRDVAGGPAAENSANPLAFRIETDWVVSAAATAKLYYGSLTIHK